MRSFISTSVLALAIALIPALRAWPTTTPPEEPSGDDEFKLLGKIDFRCGPDIEEWIINVGVGTPPQVFPMIIDTTSNLSYVNGLGCTTDFCLKEKRFDYSKSSTIVDLDTDMTLIFEDEDEIVKGKTYKDKFIFGDLIFDDIEFIDVSDTINLKPSGYAGSFAIGFDEDELPGYDEDDNQKYSKRAKGASLVGGYPPSSQGRSKRGRFRKRDNTTIVEEFICSLNFGVDYDAINGEIAWLDIPTSNFGETPLWKTQLKGVKSGDDFDFAFTDTLASFDSSVNNIEVPSCDLDKIHHGLEATRADGSTEYLFKCSNAKNLTFYFDKYDVTIPAESWIDRKEDSSGLCTARISKTEATDEPTNRWHLGTDFLEQFYTIYSVQRKQTGLALVVGGSEGVLIKPK